MAETMGSTAQRIMALRTAGMLALCMGHPEEPLHALQEAFAAASGPGTGAYAQLWSQALARVYLTLGRRRQALEQIETPGVLVDPNSADPMLLDILSMLEQACETRQDFYALCDRYRAHQPETQDPCYAQFVGWYLQPADVEMDLGGQAHYLPLQAPEWTWVDPEGDCSHTTRDGLVIHAANRGELITVIFVNNAIYGMTGGQMAPTSLPGQVTRSSPTGRDVEMAGFPMRMAELLGGLPGVAYVTRGHVTDVAGIRRAKKAIKTTQRTRHPTLVRRLYICVPSSLSSFVTVC